MNISIIAAVGMNNELGKDGKLLWSLPDELAYFREKTRGSTVIMGRKTFESIGRPLPKRRNIVITRNGGYKYEGIEVAPSLDEALRLAKDDGGVFIIGGAEIYKEALPLADTLYLTKVDGTFEADTHFPDFKEEEWQKAKEEHHEKDTSHEHAFTFFEYRKKS